MSQWDQLMVFIAVVEAKNFSQAADLLGISSAAVSKQITVLEKKLGVTLLERSTRHLTVTEAGRFIYEKGKLLQNDFTGILHYAHSVQEEPSGTLTIASTVGIGQHWVVPYLAEFMSHFPRLKVNLRLRDRIYDFDQDEPIDIAYGFPIDLLEKQSDSASLVQRRIAQTTRILCASPAYLIKYGEPKQYSDLKDHRYITHIYRNNDSVLSKCAENHIHIDPVLYLNSTEALLQCVRNGIGIASIADFIVEKDLASGSLKRVFSTHQESPTSLYFFYKKSLYLQPKITCFIKFFLEKNTSDRNQT